METICIDIGGQIAAIATGAVTLFSLLANFVKNEGAGKVIHFLAFNLRVTKK